MMRFAACLSVAFLSFVVSAFAAPRPGAPRPLQSGSTLIVGTNARFNKGTLVFTRGEDAAPKWWSATPGREEKTGERVLDWSLQSLGAFAATTINWSEGISPDRTQRAYVASRSGLESIYLESVGENRDAENIRRIATMARNPVWLDENTLIYESTQPGRKGLFRILIPTDGSTPGEPEMLFSRGGEAAISRDGKMICLAITDEKSLSRLYLLSADGSGARTLSQTEGARHPVFSPDDKAVFFDAPAPMGEDKTNAAARERVLWTLPLMASPPVAQLFSTREAKNGDVEIIGTLFSSEDNNVRAQLEFSPGEAEETGLGNQERIWFSCPLNRAPIHNGVLGSWPLPRKRDGETQAWTMRLAATDNAGERVESTLTFMWPPEKNENAENDVTMPSFFAPRPEDYGLTQEPEIATPPSQAPKIVVPKAVAPKVIAPKVAPLIFPGAKPIAKPPVAATMSTLPPPSLPPAPELEDFDANEISPVPVAIKSTPLPPLARRPVVQVAPKIVKAAAPKPVFKPKAIKQTAPKNNGGIPSQMKRSASVPVTVVLRNTGSRSWSSTGDSPVRLIYRWVNADSNIRQRWAVHWLREVVAPGKSTQMKFDLVAPSSSGSFILTYALVRLNSQNYDGKNYKPPSGNAKDHRWPGEFGAVSFNITVTP